MKNRWPYIIKNWVILFSLYFLVSDLLIVFTFFLSYRISACMVFIYWSSVFVVQSDSSGVLSYIFFLLFVVVVIFFKSVYRIHELHCYFTPFRIYQEFFMFSYFALQSKVWAKSRKKELYSNYISKPYKLRCAIMYLSRTVRAVHYSPTSIRNIIRCSKTVFTHFLFNAEPVNLMFVFHIHNSIYFFQRTSQYKWKIRWVWVT